MLGRHRQVRTQLLQLKDAILFMVALWLAYVLRADLVPQLMGPDYPQTHPLEPFEQFAWLYLVIPWGAPVALEMQGFYLRPLIGSRRATIWMLLKGCALVMVGVMLLLFLFKQSPARLVIVLFGAVSFVLMYISEEVMQIIYRSQFGQLQMTRRVILVGAPTDVARLRARIGEHGQRQAEVVGELDLNQSSIEELVRMLHDCAANTVLVHAKHTFFGQVEKAIQACEREGVEACLMADFFQTHVSQTTLDDFFGQPVLVFRSTPEASWQGVGKQVIDLIGAAVLLVVLSPLMLAVALVIRFTSPGPVFFRQQRSGLNGRPFTMLKFRSMATDAEQRKHELAALNEMSGPVFKVTNDPRVTPVGRWMRRFSVDELPQLWNVLRGEMSLVGPRPLPVDEVARFDDPSDRRRLSVKPGLTCLWQVSGRNEVHDFKDWVRLDLEYIDNWSLWLDIKILWRTIPAVFTGAGAK